MERNKGKTKSFFMCFKPSTNVDDSFKPKTDANDPVLAYLAVADEDGIVLSSTLAAVKDGREECGSRPKKKGRDMWQALRTVFNETSLAKKITGRRKTSKDKLSLSRSNSNLVVGEASGRISNPRSKTSHRTHSNSSSTLGGSSAFNSSSSLSSICSSRNEIYSPIPSNATGLTKHKQNGGEDKRKGYYGSNTALFMFLINLLVLILWGKFLAILCTSIWFYLMPPSPRKPCNEGALESDEFDSVQYKKKIIMEGLLERSHSRLSLVSSSMRKS